MSTGEALVEVVFTPAGGLISSLGMIVLGIAAMRSGVFTDWRRFVPLLVGVWFFVQIPLQIAFFISAQGSPSYALLLGVFGLLWALVGYVVWSAAGEKATRS